MSDKKKPIIFTNNKDSFSIKQNKGVLLANSMSPMAATRTSSAKSKTEKPKINSNEKGK